MNPLNWEQILKEAELEENANQKIKSLRQKNIDNKEELKKAEAERKQELSAYKFAIKYLKKLLHAQKSEEVS